MIRFHLSCLGAVIAAHALFTHAFQLQPPSSFLTTLTPPSPSITKPKTHLHGKVWDKLNIEEDHPDEDPAWYLMNCIVGSELQLLAQAKHTTLNIPAVEKLVVPTGRHLRSHGKRNVVEIKVAYPGYVFCKMRLTVETYEALQGLPLCRSWMAGTVNLKGWTKIPPAPVALGDDEVVKFRGLEVENEEMYLKYGEDYTGKGDRGEDLVGQYASYEVEDMVKVLTGNFEGEDGVVRRLKDGTIMVRMYTYGSALDQWFKPEELRKMSQLEVAKGLTCTGAIDQDKFDVSIGKTVEPKRNDNDKRRPPSLIGSVTGGTGNNGRDRRQDRMSRGERGSTDIYGRTEKQAKQEEDNWKQYREKQRDEQQNQKKKEKKVGDTWGMKENSSWADMEKDRAGVADALDTDSGWGALDDASSAPSPDTPEDDFFNSLMSELSDNLDSPKQTTGTGDNARDAQPVDDGDDFFSSLMSDLSESMDNDESTSPAKPNVPTPPTPSGSNTVSSPSSATTDDDDFFASLESDLSDSLDNTSQNDATMEQPSSQQQQQQQPDTGSEDDFFASLVTDLNKSLDSDNDNDTNGRSDASRDYEPSPVTSAPTSSQTEKELDDDFFASLEADLSQSLVDGNANTNPAPSQSKMETEDTEDDFFASLETDLSRSLDNTTPVAGSRSNTERESSSSSSLSPPSPVSSQAGNDAVIEQDFFASLETELSDMLSETSSSSSYPSSSPPTTSDDTDVSDDDFFTNLVTDLNESLDTTMDGQGDDVQQPKTNASPPTISISKVDDEDDFFASLESELSDNMLITDDSTNTSPPPSLEEDILLNVNDDESTTSTTTTKSSSKTTAKSATGGDDEAALSKMTVVALKQILREKGLKVSGKKSELIARIGGQ